jgi:hypothetical protein
MPQKLPRTRNQREFLPKGSTPVPGMTKRVPSLTLPSAETNTICITIGSPAGIIRVSNRSNRFESVLLPILSVPLFRTSRFGLGTASGTRTPQDLGPSWLSTVRIEVRVRRSLLIREPARFQASPPAFAENVSRTRPANSVTG